MRALVDRPDDDQATLRRTVDYLLDHVRGVASEPLRFYLTNARED